MKKTIEITIIVILTILISTKFNIINGVLLMLLFSSSFVLYKYIKEKYISKPYIILVFAIIIFFYTKVYLMVHRVNYSLENNLYKVCEYTGKIEKIKEGKNSKKIYFKLDYYDELVLTYISNEEYIKNEKEIFPGYRLKIKGTLIIPSESTNLGQFNEQKYLLTQKVRYKIFIKSYEIISNKKTLKTYLKILNDNLSKVYDKFFDAKNSSIIKAMIFGNSDLLDDNIKQLYTDGGIIHILAISGMHVNVISSIIESFMKKLKIKPKIIYIFSSIFLIFYMFLTGMSVSTVRAVIMNTICNVSKIINKQYSMINSLALSAILILANNPLNLFNIGFLLSFISVLIIKISPKFYKVIPFIGENTSINISVFLALTPIISYNFYEFQGLSILANIFIVPFTKLLMILSILILFLNNINVFAANILGKIVSIILEYFETILNLITKIPISKIIVGRVSLYSVIIYYVLFIITIYILEVKSDYTKKVSKKSKVIWIITLILFLCSIIRFPKTSITFLDVGHGDAIVITTSNEKTILVDGGGKNSNDNEDVGTYVLYPYLKYLGISEIDAVIITHPDNDHIKGIIEIIDKVKINKILLPKGKIQQDDKYVEIVNLCNLNDIQYESICKGYNFEIDNIIFECIYPFEDIDSYNFENNNYSLVFLAKYKNKKILLTGDLEKEGEKMILERIDEIKPNIQNIDILKVAHHGSTTSSTQEFINYISPKVAIISGDEKNTKKFNEKIKWNFKSKNTKFYYTSKSGMIKINLEGYKNENFDN